MRISPLALRPESLWQAARSRGATTAASAILGAIVAIESLHAGAPVAAANAAATADGRRLDPADRPVADPNQPEGRFVRSIEAMREGRSADALREIDAAIALAPNFQLAQMVRGDLLLARAGRLPPRLESFGQTPLIDLEREARARLAHYGRSHHEADAPRAIVRLAPGQHYALVVDISENRLYVYRNEGGEPRYVTDYYTTTGRDGALKSEEGDARTPVGVYNVVSNIDRRKLTDFYGTGAFPLSYPNEWDRMLGRQGHGIWLHGTPHDSYSRPPRASNGCVVLANKDLDSLGKIIEVGVTPVVIAEHIDWIPREAARAEGEALMRSLSNTGAPPTLSQDDRVLPSALAPNFGARKVRVDYVAQGAIPSAPAPRLPKDDGLAVFRYPGADQLMLITFDRARAGEDMRRGSTVRQYWSRDKETWKIVYETQ